MSNPARGRKRKYIKKEREWRRKIWFRKIMKEWKKIWDVVELKKEEKWEKKRGERKNKKQGSVHFN